MILCIIYHFLIVSILFKYSYSQRKINGLPVENNSKKYVAYFVKAEQSPRQYDAWLCGGAIVSKDLLVTSAACVLDVEYMYAIVGYQKYVPSHQINTDPCTNKLKKKVIWTCVPKHYQFEYGRVDVWSNIDIAIVKVESPFNFNDDAYEQLCSYKPAIIPINYDNRYQAPNTDAFVLGWGHTETWRDLNDTADHNEQLLNYASVLIHDKEDCKKHYAGMQNMNTVIEKYMICTKDSGHLDLNGHAFDNHEDTELADGCTKNADCIHRKEFKNESSDITYDGIDYGNTSLDYLSLFGTRRNGICQNDHGGPLVTWIGGHETLIGVASVFLVNNERECVGPYLYTSTQCNGAFLSCILKVADQTTVPMQAYDLNDKLCKELNTDQGIKTVQNPISWVNHPQGPSENELRSPKFLHSFKQKRVLPTKYKDQPEMRMRPQIPLHNIGKKK